MQFVIEKDVEIPPPSKGGWKYPYLQLEVGESFATGLHNYNAIRVGCHKAGKKYGRKFSIRKLEGQVRCWRIA